MLKAIIFDVDGTLADTESYHLQAFNKAFAHLNINWYWDEETYTDLLQITGGKERLLHYWCTYHEDDYERQTLDAIKHRITTLHQLKTAFYTQLASNPGIPLRPGIKELIINAHQQNIQLAIATTTTPDNIAALLQKHFGTYWQDYFVVIEDASTAELKKPHPQAYLQALERLGLPASNCLVIEDSRNGFLAAQDAGLEVVITPTRFTRHQHCSGAYMRIHNLTRPLACLQDWQQDFQKKDQGYANTKKNNFDAIPY
ncbi:MAG: HAD-IA family hydrolase [Marinospirillum sp.]|uniref:HAD-IA family hydrolase n=1 Tax=Marinospirillum sp. TaxID=2183934 RepID=UPI0019F57940|nr:HAD-IA family hydrolase [Marinospirillum sp.]MBE0507271.1 HAD-IA family hydrolase [Marinospirillum sp.]